LAKYLILDKENSNMGVLKINLEDEILKKIQEEAARRFGYTKKSLGMAAREAFTQWLKTKEKKSKKEVLNFEKVLKKVAGSWKVENGKNYAKKLRSEWKKRERRLSL